MIRCNLGAFFPPPVRIYIKKKSAYCSVHLYNSPWISFPKQTDVRVFMLISSLGVISLAFVSVCQLSHKNVMLDI